MVNTMLDTHSLAAAAARAPLSARSVLATAPLSWKLVHEAASSVTVEVTTRHAREDAEERLAGSSAYLLTSTVEITREDWQVWATQGPELSADDADELCADVARALESGRGVRYRDLPLVADLAEAA